MLRWRLISALVILAVLCCLLWLDFRGPAGAWLAPLLVLLAVAATQEMLSMAAERKWKPVAWPAYTGAVVVVLAASLPAVLRGWPSQTETLASQPDQLAPDLALLGWTLVGVAVAIALIVIGELLVYVKPGDVLANVAVSAFTVTFISVQLSFLAALRFLGGGSFGMAALLSMVLVVKCSDVGQYTFGRIFGRHKLAPKVSPGKTIEGALGGVLTACLVAWLSLTCLVPALAGPAPITLTWWHSLSFGVWVALAGMLGDLSVSMIKRDVGVKDSSRWLPGLGGVLDVIDSVLLAAPAAYVWWLAVTG